MNDEYQAALEFLFSRLDYERALHAPYNPQAFKLERTRQLLQRLGNPHERLKIVHVAGTKGKGSTAAMIAAILTAAGYRTGLFSSPHLERVEERFAIDGQPCTSAELAELVELVKPAVAEMDAEAAIDNGGGLTFFEITTAMGMLHFARRNVDAAVLEVGMGGRLDSTNVCRPIACAITSISFDHTRQLGNTLAKIATEKAGIIKANTPVVLGDIDGEALEAIVRVATERNARVVRSGNDYSVNYEPGAPSTDGARGLVTFKGLEQLTGEPRRQFPLGLLGRHQAMNAAVALAVLREILPHGFQVPHTAIAEGLAKRAACPARIEVVGAKPAVVLDAAHNLASVEALARTLGESFLARRRILVFGTTTDKDVRGMLSALAPRFDDVIFTQYQKNRRGAPPSELLALASELGYAHCRIAATPAEALAVARRLALPDDLICVTGSFFLAAEVRPLLLSGAEAAGYTSVAAVGATT